MGWEMIRREGFPPNWACFGDSGEIFGRWLVFGLVLNDVCGFLGGKLQLQLTTPTRRCLPAILFNVYC